MEHTKWGDIHIYTVLLALCYVLPRTDLFYVLLVSTHIPVCKGKPGHLKACHYLFIRMLFQTQKKELLKTTIENSE